MEYTLKIVKEKSETRYLLCDIHGNYYNLSKLIFDMVSQYRLLENYTEVLVSLKKLYPDLHLTEEIIRESINRITAIVNGTTKKNTKRSSYLHYAITLVKAGKGIRLYKVLGFLFNPYVFAFLLTTAVVFTLHFFCSFESNAVAGIISTITPGYIGIYYLLFMLFIFFHEIGHATAASKYGIQPKEIGAGIYFIFPVLYTNVTDIWTLPAAKRAIVNLGGIYFQLLINAILILLLHSGYFHNAGLILLIISNSISILISFNPFFRYDGYWILSDWSGISNLRKRASDLLVQMIIRPSKIRQHITYQNIPASLIIYSIANATFWITAYLLIGNYLIATISTLNTEASLQKPILHHEQTRQTAEKLFILFWLSIAGAYTLFQFLKALYYEKFRKISC